MIAVSTKSEPQYILYVDEAGDDKVANLKPDCPSGSSEWLCLGGYLVRSTQDGKLEDTRDHLLKCIGGVPGNHLHYRNYKAKNRVKICRELASATYPAKTLLPIHQSK